MLMQLVFAGHLQVVKAEHSPIQNAAEVEFDDMD